MRANAHRSFFSAFRQNIGPKCGNPGDAARHLCFETRWLIIARMMG
jgi:hypothetical protein